MNYEQNNIRNFFLEREALKISKLEEICNIPNDSLRHFIKNRRSLAPKHLERLIAEIIKYGFVESQ